MREGEPADELPGPDPRRDGPDKRLGEPLEGCIEVLAVKRAEPRIVGGLELRQQSGALGLLEEPPNPWGEQGPQDILDGRAAAARLDLFKEEESALVEGAKGSPEDLIDEAVAPAEVAVGKGDVRTGLGQDRPDRHSLDPPLREEPFRGDEDPLPSFTDSPWAARAALWRVCNHATARM